MTYRIDPNPTFWKIVTVREPGDDGKVQTFRGKFRALEVDELESYDLSSGTDTRAFLEKVLLDFEDVVDDNGFAVPYALAQAAMLRIPHVRHGLVRAYLSGFVEGSAGNFVPPPAPGRQER